MACHHTLHHKRPSHFHHEESHSSWYATKVSRPIWAQIKKVVVVRPITVWHLHAACRHLSNDHSRNGTKQSCPHSFIHSSILYALFLVNVLAISIRGRRRSRLLFLFECQHVLQQRLATLGNAQFHAAAVHARLLLRRRRRRRRLHTTFWWSCC